MNFAEVGRFLLVAGVSITIIGVFFLLSDKLPIGQLPGDVNFSRGSIQISLPIMTCILLSVALTIVVNFFSK
ncbi:MAG: DUF2905 domain-containing protein [Chitinivibrionia bacterium]|nr:DUF2905 domain-containing protein [Chitinivibrionia bacterium]